MSNNTQFSVNIGANLVTDNIQKQLESLNAKLVKSTNTKFKIPIEFDDKGIATKFANAIKQVNTYKDAYGNLYKQTLKFKELQDELGKGTGKFELISDPNDSLKSVSSKVRELTTEVHKWTDTQGAIQKWTTTIDNSGQIVSTRVKQVVDGMGNITTTTSKLVSEGAGKPFKKMGDDIVQISEILKETTTQTTTSFGKITDTINGVTKTFDGTTTTIKKMSSDGEELTTEISKYVNEMGQAVEVTKQFDKNGNQVATTMRKISEATDTKKATFIDKDGNKTITEYKDCVAILRTEIKKYTDEVGNLITQTDKYDAQTNKLISTHQDLTRNVHQAIEEDKKREQELANVIEKINQERLAQERLKEAITTTTTTHSRGKVQQFGSTLDTTEYDALITKTVQVNEANEKVIKTTYEFTNAQGQLVRQTRTTDGQLNKIAEDVVEVSDGFKRTGESAERANHGVRNLGWNLGDAISRLSNFYIASLPIRAVQTAITETISTVKDFDSALIEFRKVSDLAGESLTNYVAKLAEMGEVTGSTMQAMVEASTEFRKSGFSDNDSAQLASIAEKYRNIADEEISAGESASFIIAQMKAFNVEAGQAEHIIDSVNEV